MEEKWTVQEVRDKVDWEGGIFETLRWGLSANRIKDPKLAALWEKLEEVEEVVRQIEKIIYGEG